MTGFNLFVYRNTIRDHWKCDSAGIIALSGKLFYDGVNYRVNRAERQIFLKPFLYNARLE